MCILLVGGQHNLLSSIILIERLSNDCCHSNQLKQIQKLYKTSENIVNTVESGYNIWYNMILHRTRMSYAVCVMIIGEKI